MAWRVRASAVPSRLMVRGGREMRRARASRAPVAVALVAAMVLSITGLLGAPSAKVTVTSPAAGARVSGTVDVRASITGGSGLSYVILGVDDQRPQSSNSAPFAFELDTRTLSDGPHRVFVEAYDRYGLIGTSSAITIHVKNGTAPPVRVETAPKTQVAKAPTPPSRSSAANSSRPQVESAAQATTEAAETSPMVAGRGPTPAPVRSAADSTLAVAGDDNPAATGGRAVASAPVGSAPPQPSPRQVRGHTVVLNGRAVEFDVAPFIVDNRMQAGFRALFESNGARVSWISEHRTARSVQPGLLVEVPVGSRIALVNGQQVEMNTAAMIEKGRTVIPVRFFADATGSIVRWDSSTQTASVESKSRAIAGGFPGSS